MVNPGLWILETAFHALVPLRMLVSAQMEYLHNKPSHGLSPKRLAELLERLNWDGDIFLEDQDGMRRLFSAGELLQMLSIPRSDREPTYGLTEKGGLRWEVESYADWSRFISDLTIDERGKPTRREIVCVDPDRFEEYLSLWLPVWGEAIDSATETRDVLRPWETTYWKTLPVGYRLQGRTTGRHRSEQFSAGLRLEEWRRWYRASYE